MAGRMKRRDGAQRAAPKPGSGGYLRGRREWRRGLALGGEGAGGTVGSKAAGKERGRHLYTVRLRKR